jgi:hypothetical protein
MARLADRTTDKLAGPVVVAIELLRRLRAPALPAHEVRFRRPEWIVDPRMPEVEIPSDD